MSYAYQNRGANMVMWTQASGRPPAAARLQQQTGVGEIPLPGAPEYVMSDTVAPDGSISGLVKAGLLIGAGFLAYKYLLKRK